MLTRLLAVREVRQPLCNGASFRKFRLSSNLGGRVLRKEQMQWRERERLQLLSETPEGKVKIATEYVAWLTQKPKCFVFLQDESVLPYAKDVLLRAFIHMIANTDDEEVAEYFTLQAMQLGHYQPNVDSTELPAPDITDIEGWGKKFNFKLFNDRISAVDKDCKRFLDQARGAKAANYHFHSFLRKMWSFIVRRHQYHPKFTGNVPYPPLSHLGPPELRQAVREAHFGRKPARARKGGG